MQREFIGSIGRSFFFGTQWRKKAVAVRVPLPAAVRPNQRWSMDFISDRVADGRWFRVLTVVDQFTRPEEFRALWKKIKPAQNSPAGMIV
jgi:hypothetical protein